LLSGLLRCGRCGRKLFVVYAGIGGRVPRYGCRGGRTERGAAACQSLGSLRVDRAVVDLVLEAIQPAAIAAATDALERALDEDHEKQQAVAMAVEKARYEVRRAQRQFDAVDPDNVDGYANPTGFDFTDDDQLAFNRWLAEGAHERGLGVALKNDLGQIPDLVAWFDFAVNEECFQFDECDLLAPFVDAGKAVLAIDYAGDEEVCSRAEARGLSLLFKDHDLTASGHPCP